MYVYLLFLWFKICVVWCVRVCMSMKRIMGQKKFVDEQKLSGRAQLNRPNSKDEHGPQDFAQSSNTSVVLFLLYFILFSSVKWTFARSTCTQTSQDLTDFQKKNLKRLAGFRSILLSVRFLVLNLSNSDWIRNNWVRKPNWIEILLNNNAKQNQKKNTENKRCLLLGCLQTNVLYVYCESENLVCRFLSINVELCD